MMLYSASVPHSQVRAAAGQRVVLPGHPQGGQHRSQLQKASGGVKLHLSLEHAGGPMTPYPKRGGSGERQRKRYRLSEACTNRVSPHPPGARPPPRVGCTTG